MMSWTLVENEFDADKLLLNETLYNTANGYIGVRGNFEEELRDVKTVRGAYINAFYAKEELQYAEKFPGFADDTQTLLNVIDAQTIELYLDDEKFSIAAGKILSYKQTLDLKQGVVTRHIHWQSFQGKEIKINIKRCASFACRELFFIVYDVESINFSGKFKIASRLNGHVQNISSEDDPRLRASTGPVLRVKLIDNYDDISTIQCKTKRSKLSVVCSMAHKISKVMKETSEVNATDIVRTFVGEITPGESVSLEKQVVYTDSRRHPQTLEANHQTIRGTINNGCDYYLEQQSKYLADFWRTADVEINGDDKLQQAIRYSVFQLLQSVGKDKFSNIAAKGLSGEGYQGHYFWDTEIYIFPFFLFTNPVFAKNLLLFRYNILDKARDIARSMSHPKGALYPWRTIDGDECSGFFPSGRAQYHINPDVAYSVIQYYQVTEDKNFIASYGAEILFELARVMFDVGHFRRDGRFCIDEVTGPDEYSCCANNNYYTNVMTKYLFENTRRFWSLLAESFPEDLVRLKEKIGITQSEIAAFEKAGDNMFLPFDEMLKVSAQDDSFLDKKQWDINSIPRSNFPLLMSYHPLVLYRHQVCKQADVVLADFLREEETTVDIIKNNFDYYEKITTHDSSLSKCIFSIVASRLGYAEKAYDYFMATARLDLDDLHENSKDGLHTACLGGSWMSIVFGFAGMRVKGGKLHFYPRMPKSWDRLSFKINFKGRVLRITLAESDFEVELSEGEGMEIYVNDELTVVEKAKVTAR